MPVESNRRVRYNERVKLKPDETHATAQAIALFVFVPFCRIKCTYCDFNAYANLARVMEPYAGAVCREVTASRHAGARAKSVYFGGGTPSIVPAEQIAAILAGLARTFTIESGAEITLEANPGTLDERKLAALLSLGVNRLSLGVQSFDDATLRRLNRGHTVADALNTFRTARRVGFDNVNLDLIYGLPLQTLADWRASLDQALALEPDHLSLYALKVEEGTGLAFQLDRGKYPAPDDDLAADMYDLAEEMMGRDGFEHYEISNWARSDAPRSHEVGNESRDVATTPSPRRSIHNLTYWLDEPYLGFGAGAHSYSGGVRYWNVLSPVEYIARMERGEDPIAGREEIGRDVEMAETMFLGLRLREGVAYERFQARFGVDVREIYGRQLREVADLGLVEMTDAAVRLTPRGRLLSNEVFWRFLPDS